jgi:hypothetical protein
MNKEQDINYLLTLIFSLDMRIKELETRMDIVQGIEKIESDQEIISRRKWESNNQ